MGQKRGSGSSRIASSAAPPAKRRKHQALDPSPIGPRNFDNQDVYRYIPIAADQTRVLVLEPGTAPDPLYGELVVHADPELPYAAISYAWGTLGLDRKITLGGRELAITLAAKAALERFRDPIKPRRLWIDSVCIDQSNTSEKNSQVARMGAIYQNAEEVLVWLGVSLESDSMAFWACNKLNHAWEACDTYSHTEDEHWEGSRKSGFARDALTKEAFTNSCPCCNVPCERDQKRLRALKSSSMFLYDAAQSSVHHLFERKYFERLWPVQEISMAQRCTLYAGLHTISFSTASHALDMLSTMQAQLIPQTKLYQFLTSITAGLRGNTNEGKRFADFFRLLETTAPLTSGNPRDRVYALRSLIHPQIADALKPDYNIRMRDLWIKTTITCLEATPCTLSSPVTSVCSITNGPMLLAMAAAQQQVRADEQIFPVRFDKSSGQPLLSYYKSLRLPSWAADLQGRETVLWKKYRYYSTEAHNFSAGGQGRFSAKLAVGKRDQLVLAGIAMSKVISVDKHTIHPDRYKDVFLPVKDARKTKIRSIQLGSAEMDGQAEDNDALAANNVTPAIDDPSISRLRRQKNAMYLRWFRHCHRTFSHNTEMVDAANFTTQATSFLLQGHRHLSPSGTAAFEPELKNFEAMARRDIFETRYLIERHIDMRKGTRKEVAEKKRLAKKHSHLKTRSATKVWSTLPEPDYYNHVRAVFQQAFPTLRNPAHHPCMDQSRAIGKLDDGRLAWVPSSSTFGDQIFLIQGAPCPFVLRPHADGGYLLIGDAYVHGIMYGEAVGTDEDEAAFEEVVIR